jgi:hypothetical protein
MTRQSVEDDNHRREIPIEPAREPGRILGRFYDGGWSSVYRNENNPW